MLRIRRLVSVALLILVPLAAGCATAPRGRATTASGVQGVVVASHPLAAEIGLDVLKSGGNAVDAAVATGLALGVVDQFNSGVGGGGFIVIRMADGTVHTIDGRETAPASATRDMYIRGGEYDQKLSKVGPLAVGVPGILAAYESALGLAGTRKLSELIAPSIKVAEEGFELDEYYISRYSDAIEQLGRDAASAKIYLRPDGSPLAEGDILRQPDLAQTYRNIEGGGTEYFYKGGFAGRLARYMEQNGGLITLADMAEYAPRAREPVIGRYGDFDIIGMGPPSSGGVHTVQILNMLEASGILQEKSDWDLDSIFWTAMYMRKAFEDRAIHLGDSDFHHVPIDRLTSKRYAKTSLKALESGEKQVVPEKTGLIPAPSHTTNICVVDRWGNAAAVNQTVNLTYGAKITLPGTGVILNNEMDDFSARPGVPNAFGLIGSEANSVAPGKRPLSSMAPTIVAKDGKTVLILGGAGGPTIITGVLHVIVNMLDFGDELVEAQAKPRFHHQFRPDLIIVESGMAEETRRELQAIKGQPSMVRESLGRINAIAWSEKEQAYVGSPDPRLRGGAAAY